MTISENVKEGQMAKKKKTSRRSRKYTVLNCMYDLSDEMNRQLTNHGWLWLLHGLLAVMAVHMRKDPVRPFLQRDNPDRFGVDDRLVLSLKEDVQLVVTRESFQRKPDEAVVTVLVPEDESKKAYRRVRVLRFSAPKWEENSVVQTVEEVALSVIERERHKRSKRTARRS